MATKKQMTETINRVDIVEDNMLKIEDNISLLREMIIMQNKHIESMMHSIINNTLKKTDNEKKEKETIVIVDDTSSDNGDYINKKNINKTGQHLKYSRRII